MRSNFAMREILKVVAVMMFPLLAIAETDNGKLSKEELVRNKVLKDYQKLTLPQRNHNNSLPITYRIYLIGVWIEEQMQVVHVNTWVKMNWTDPRLSWDPKDYGGITEVHFGFDEVWKPDIFLINNAVIQDTAHYGPTNIIVMNDGQVLWVPPATFRAECGLDLTLWPYDVQHCHLMLASWTRHGNQLDVQLYNNSNHREIDRSWMMKYSHEWQFQKGIMFRFKFTPKSMPDPYIILHMVIQLARMSSIFTSTVVIPAIVVSVLTLSQFILPIRNKLRVILGCITLLLCMLMIIYLATELPPLAQSVPIVVKFFGQTLGVSLVSVCLSAWLLHLTDTHQPSPMSTPPPAMLKNLLTGPLSRILCLTAYTDKVGASMTGVDEGEILEDSKPPSYAHEWLLVAAFVDRLSLIFFTAVFSITLLVHIAPV